MGTIQEAERVLLRARDKLQSLLEQAVKDQQYSEVAELARMTEALTGIAKAGSGKHQVAAVSNAWTPTAPRKRAKEKADTNGRTYPVFKREGDRLVKVGWSKKHRSEYEHRAPREAVAAFMQHLESSVRGSDLFDMESLLPVPDSSGGEVPDYQAYLTLRWLQEVGIVEKRGRDGYVLRTRARGDNDFEKLWSGIPTRN